jgi:hypothetical protein
MSEPTPPVPAVSASFFASISQEGYPPTVVRSQPWKDLWNQIQQPLSQDGKTIVACASCYDFSIVLYAFFYDSY